MTALVFASCSHRPPSLTTTLISLGPVRGLLGDQAVDGRFGRRKSEDRPAVPGVDRIPAKQVMEERTVRSRVLAVESSTLTRSSLVRRPGVYLADHETERHPHDFLCAG